MPHRNRRRETAPPPLNTIDQLTCSPLFAHSSAGPANPTTHVPPPAVRPAATPCARSRHRRHATGFPSTAHSTSSPVISSVVLLAIH
jgi:hypothetical protein